MLTNIKLETASVMEVRLQQLRTNRRGPDVDVCVCVNASGVTFSYYQPLLPVTNAATEHFRRLSVDVIKSALLDNAVAYISIKLRTVIIFTCAHAAGRYCFFTASVCLCICPHKISKTAGRKLM